MCGICGFVGDAGDDTLREMRDVLTHRGPDGAGEFRERDVALGHRRLAIVDLEGGAQPLHSIDGSVVVVFNGEIYNHPALKRDLEARGFVYATHSDTESIVNAYRAYGEDCVQHLDGMFAFVLYDRARRRLFGARDRFGKKPFYYSRPPGNGARGFAFASEVRSLLRHPRVRAEASISAEGVQQFLLHDYLPGKHSIFANIWKLEAGQAFSIDLASDDREPRIWTYWHNAIEEPSALRIAPQEAAEEVLRLLRGSIERRLMADVPIGVFLSGGLDSSAITALLAQLRPARDIETFSIGFAERSFDETPHATLVAEHIGTRHRSRSFAASDCLAEWGRIAAHMDEPFADPSILPTSMLSRFARETVTVALGGDGGDELFAGYDPIVALAPARVYTAVTPRSIDRGLAAALRRCVPSTTKNMDWSFRAQRFLRGTGAAASTRLAVWMGAFGPTELARLVGRPTDAAALLEPEASLYTAVRGRGGDDVRAALAYFQRFYLTDDVLVKADRASMLHSLEVRAPFLDTALADFVNRLPSSLKYRFGTRKYLLKLALSRQAGGRDLLPSAIVHRSKKGFGVPVAQWIRHDLRSDFAERLVDAWPTSLAFIERREVARLFAEHVNGRANHYKELWALFVLAEWARRWVA